MALAVPQLGNKAQTICQSCTVSDALRGWVRAEMNQLLNYFATSTYRIMTGVKWLTKCVIRQSSYQSPALSSHTQYMINNCTLLVTFSETHDIHI